MVGKTTYIRRPDVVERIESYLGTSFPLFHACPRTRSGRGRRGRGRGKPAHIASAVSRLWPPARTWDSPCVRCGWLRWPPDCAWDSSTADCRSGSWWRRTSPPVLSSNGNSCCHYKKLQQETLINTQTLHHIKNSRYLQPQAWELRVAMTFDKSGAIQLTFFAGQDKSSN